MAFVGALDAFNSEPIPTTVPNSTKPLFTATSTKVTRDTSGKVTGGTTTVHYSADAGSYVPAATTTDGGKSWTYLKDANGKEIFGASAKNSLEKGALKTNTQQQILAATKKGPLGGGGLTPEEQKTVAPSTQNTATNSEAGDSVSAGDITGADTKLGSLTKLGETGGAISSDDKRNRDISKYPENNLLKYPIDLNPQEQDYISFTMLKYSPKKYSDIASFGETGKIGERNSQETRRGSTVVLPIQPSISDTNTVEWGSDTMDAPSLIAASLALNTITDGAEGAGKSIKGIVGLIGKGNEDIQTAVAAAAAGAVAGTKGLLTRVTGGIINPNMELLFNGPQLRNFQFSFTLSAREPEESKNIRNIIRFFKQGMSVKRSDTDLFLQSPNTFQIKYNYKGSEHPWINKIKECALTGCSVNYTPAGSYATFIDGAMTSYEIGLQFAELEAIYDDDYKNSGGKGNESEIGY